MAQVQARSTEEQCIWPCHSRDGGCQLGITSPLSYPGPASQASCPVPASPSPPGPCKAARLWEAPILGLQGLRDRILMPSGLRLVPPSSPALPLPRAPASVARDHLRAPMCVGTGRLAGGCSSPWAEALPSSPEALMQLLAAASRCPAFKFHSMRLLFECACAGRRRGGCRGTHLLTDFVNLPAKQSTPQPPLLHQPPCPTACPRAMHYRSKLTYMQLHQA